MATSIALTDGARPNVYADLARGVFDAAGRYYTAWVELGDSNAPFGGTLGGSTQNAIELARIDAGSAAAGANVRVSQTADSRRVRRPGDRRRPRRERAPTSPVVVAKSTDQGAHFSPPVKVNDDAHCASHIHPALLVDAAGRLTVFFYDARDGVGHFLYAVSDDGGASFHANRLVSAPAFPFDSFQYSTGWLGDYYAPALVGGDIYAIWTDGREGDQSHAFLAKGRMP